MADQIDLIIAGLDEFTGGEVIALALNVNANLRDSPPLGTPIDTGWASANWVPSVGQPYDDSSAAGVTEPTEAHISAQEREASKGLNDVLAYKLEDGPVFSSNNVPYIGALNAGHSDQSPPGFIQIAIEKAIKDTYSSASAKRDRNARAATARAARPRPRR